MTTKTTRHERFVSVRWKTAADALATAIGARDAFAAHGADCRTCREQHNVEGCPTGRPLRDSALDLTDQALASYDTAKRALA